MNSQNNNQKIWGRRAAVFFLTAFLLLSFSGCKESDVLFHTTYNQKAEQQSDDDQMVNNDKQNEDVNQDLSSKEDREESDNKRGYENTEAVESDSENDSRAAQTVDSPNTNDRQNGYSSSGSSSSNKNGDGGNSGNGQSDGSGTGNGSGTGGAQLGSGSGGSSGSASGGSGGGEGSGSGSSEKSSEGDGSTGESGSEADSAGENGDKIHSSDTVFAAGEAALLVQMLGGSGALMGADKTEIDAMAQYFPSEELSGITPIFDENGVINTAVIDAMTTLPACCLLDTSNYTEAVEEAMNSYGISCLVLDFRNASGILNAVETVRETVGTDTADANADAYTTLYNGILELADQKIGTFSENSINFDNTPGSSRKKNLTSTCSDGKYTLLVTGWDYGQSLTFTKPTGWMKTFSGLAVASRGYTDSPASYFMQRAGTLNKGATTVLYTDYTSVYVNPLRTVVHGAALSVPGILSLENQDTVNHYESLNESKLTEGLGSSSYPAVIAATSEVRDAILNDKQNNGTWTLYDFDENNRNRGIADPDGSYIWSVISGDYDVYVNPAGLGDWAAGSAESVLETVWTGNMFHNKAFTDSELISYIRQYYSTFYRCDLTDEQVSAILAGS